jgi:TPR repeat protein
VANSSLLIFALFLCLSGCSKRPVMPPETTFSPELKLRAEQGDLPSQHQFGVVLIVGAGVPQNHKEGFGWLSKASAKNYAPSQFMCGTILRLAGQADQGLELIQRAAEQGLPEAQMLLGTIYLNGDGISKDVTQAIFWLRKAGDGGNGDAFTNLGNIYCDGDGVPRDPRKGVGYHKKSADMGSLHGQNDYAWFLATSPEAKDRDGREAVRLAERAVRQRRDCNTLDTLAAAYAEDGQFEKAVEAQKESIQKLKNLDEETRREWQMLPTLEDSEIRLRLYQDGMPFREE